MYIYWLGESSFKIKSRQAILIIDPAAKSTGLPQSALKADVVLISGTIDTNLKRVQASEKNLSPFVVQGPGEYETCGIFIYGLPGKNNNTLYLIKIDDLQIAHLSGLSEVLNDQQLQLFEGADIALVPVGNHGLLSGKQADKVISQLEPKIVIPTNYQLPKLKTVRGPVDVFLSEMGVKGLPPENSLYVTKAKLPPEETKIVLLQC